MNAQTLTAEVTVLTKDIGHEFPTGFAFARQWWLEVSAQTQNGDPRLPQSRGPGHRTGRPARGIDSPCSSGTLNTPQEDLRTCDPRQVAGTFGDELEAAGKPVNNANLVLTVPAPLTDCDPWLTNFQKILTDGDPEGTGQFLEVPYQSLLPDIVQAADARRDPTGDGAAEGLRPARDLGGRSARRPSSTSSTPPRAPGQKVTVDFACTCATCRRTSSPGSTACIRTT